MNAFPTALAALALSALASVAAAAGAGANRPPAPIALTAAPSRLQLAPGASAAIQLTNPGRASVVVKASAAGYAVDARGRPHVAPGPRGARVRLVPSPRRLMLPPSGRAALTLSVRAAPGTAPGDHTALLLLATEPSRSGGVPARVRIGVVVVVRVPGVVVRRLALRGIRLRRAGRARLLDIVIADRGNVDEWVGTRRLSITLVRGGRVVARPRPAARRFLARTSGVAEARAPDSLHGPVRVVVRLNRPRPGVAALSRSYPLRL